MAIVLHSEYVKRASAAHAESKAEANPTDYRELVFRCALAICGEPDGAEDVAQEVLMILFRSRQRLLSIENPPSWVRRITVRCATRYLKRSRTTDRLSETLQASEVPADNLAVYEVLRQLTPGQRAILGMALNQGLSYREIAEALDIPEGTVGSRLNAAKKEFQRKWEK